MVRLVVSGELLTHFITYPEGYIRSELNYDVLKWLNTQMTAFWYPDIDSISDGIIIYFDSIEDAISFKLTWMIDAENYNT
jgi:hypothetical protein